MVCFRRASISIQLIIARVDRAFAHEVVDSRSILNRVKPKTIKIALTANLLDAQHEKEQYEAFTLCDRQLGR